MSNFNMEPITCPNCKTEQKIKVWESVDIAKSPKEKAKIISGEFFQFKCKKCDFSAPLAYNCLYSDIENKMLIWLIPELTDEVKDKLTTAETLKGDNEHPTNDYIYRIVTTPNELKEKIMINDAGLDDRVVELLKMVYMSQLTTLTGDKTIAEEAITEMYLDIQDEDKYSFVIFFEKREPLMIPVNYDVYIKLYADFIEMIEQEHEEKFVEIDFEWAKKMFFKKMKKTIDN